MDHITPPVDTPASLDDVQSVAGTIVSQTTAGGDDISLPTAKTSAEIVKMVMEEETFQTRVEMVADILGLEVIPDVKPGKGIVSTVVSSHMSTSKVFLPPATAFAEQFDKFLDELAARPGSFRAQNPKNKAPLEVDQLPSRKKPKLDEYYKLPGQSWLTAAVDP